MPTWLVVVAVIVLALACLAGLDRVLLLAEARGLVYYRRKRPSSASVGNAMMDAMSIYEPGFEHLVEERRRADGDEAEDDEPLDRPAGPPARPNTPRGADE
jgi:hypothetical protein